MHEDVPPSSGTAALDKGLRILQLILRDRGQTPIRTLAASLNLSASTSHRLLAALEARGLIARVGRGTYDIGISLGYALEGVSGLEQLTRVSRSHLRRLAAAAHATAHLAVLEDDMVTYLVKAPQAQSSLADFAREKQQLEAYSTGIGKVLLAFLPDAERSRYLSTGHFVPLTETTIVDPRQLEQCLDTVRKVGWARDDEETRLGLYCLGAPIRAANGEVLAAISLSFDRASQIMEEDACYVAALRACAARIERQVGLDPNLA